MSVQPLRLIRGPDDILNQSTISGVVSSYLDAKRAEQVVGIVGARTIDKLERYLGIFVGDFPAFSKPKRSGLVSECERKDLTVWLGAHPEWDSGFTRQDAVASVVSCFRWAEDEHVIPGRCPYRRPKFLGKLLKPRPAITPGEYRAMMVGARNAKTQGGASARKRPRRTITPFRAALIFLWKTGCRPSEMRAAEWDMIDWQRGLLVMSEGKTVNATGQERLVPIRCVLPLLRWLFARRKKGQLTIFANTLGRPWTCGVFSKEFRRYAELAGIRKKVSAYCLRHGFCVRLLEAGASDRQAADCLGHATTRWRFYASCIGQFWCCGGHDSYLKNVFVVSQYQ